MYRKYPHHIESARFDTMLRQTLRMTDRLDDRDLLCTFTSDFRAFTVKVESFEQSIAIAYAKNDDATVKTQAARFATLLKDIGFANLEIDAPVFVYSFAYAQMAERQDIQQDLLRFHKAKRMTVRTQGTPWEVLADAFAEVHQNKLASMRLTARELKKHVLAFDPANPLVEELTLLAGLLEAFSAKNRVILDQTAALRERKRWQSLMAGQTDLKENWKALFDPLSYAILLMAKQEGMHVHGTVTAQTAIKEKPAAVAQQNTLKAAANSSASPSSSSGQWKIL